NQVIRLKVMSPSTPGANEIFNDTNYFLWVQCTNDVGAEGSARSCDADEARASDAAGNRGVESRRHESSCCFVQSNVPDNDSRSHYGARSMGDFFVKQSLHNRVRLRKQLHDFQMDQGGNRMEHFLQFDDCACVLLLWEIALETTSDFEYDNMVKIVEAHENMTLQCAKEMLRREFETITKREKQEGAFRAGGIRHGRNPRERARGNQPKWNGQARFNDNKMGKKREDTRTYRRQGNERNPRFTGKCFECGSEGHKQAQCNRRRHGDDDNEYVFSATSENSTTWLLDSGASSHMTFEASDFVELRSLKGSLTISIANGHRLPVRGIGTVRLATPRGTVVRLTDVMYVPELDRKLLSVHALTAKSVEVRFVIGNIKKCGKLYEWQVKVPDVKTLKKNEEEWGMMTPEVAASSTCTSDANVWHARLGHPSAERLQAVVGAAEGVPVILQQVNGDALGVR
ncbi:TPA: LOW QUALITY PROTEIN: hypothetical protein N0F65_003974, partial [Lagenidium giganteum]